jgi:hypothetical protein
MPGTILGTGDTELKMKTKPWPSWIFHPLQRDISLSKTTRCDCDGGRYMEVFQMCGNLTYSFNTDIHTHIYIYIYIERERERERERWYFLSYRHGSSLGDGKKKGESELRGKSRA